MAVEEFADDLVKLPPVDQIAAAQVPDKPFASAEVRGYHVSGFLRKYGV
jgi:hypothetical protein